MESWKICTFAPKAACKRTQQLPTLLRQQCWELLRACWQWSANGYNNSQQCWDLQCIVGRTQPISLCKPCVIRIRLHTTANTDATTPNIVGATMLEVVASAVCTHPYVSLGVVASVRTPLPTRTQQLPTMLGVVESFARRRRFRYFLVHDWPSGIVILGYLAQVSTIFS